VENGVGRLAVYCCGRLGWAWKGLKATSRPFRAFTSGSLRTLRVVCAELRERVRVPGSDGVVREVSLGALGALLP
jgi:hypothetical protein